MIWIWQMYYVRLIFLRNRIAPEAPGTLVT